jgi:hypothetical protein
MECRTLQGFGSELLPWITAHESGAEFSAGRVLRSYELRSVDIAVQPHRPVRVIATWSMKEESHLMRKPGENGDSPGFTHR